jgi:hypothetical protein
MVQVPLSLYIYHHVSGRHAQRSMLNCMSIFKQNLLFRFDILVIEKKCFNQVCENIGRSKDVFNRAVSLLYFLCSSKYLFPSSLPNPCT